jgi:hypothetical protein
MILMKKILAIVFALCVGIAFAAPIRSMLASRGEEFVESEKDPPYPLPDGVVAVEYLQGDGASGILVPYNIRNQYGTISLAYYNTDYTKSSYVFGQRLIGGANNFAFTLQHNRNQNRLFRQYSQFFVNPYNGGSQWYSSLENGQLTKLFTYSLDISTKTATWYNGSETVLTSSDFPESSNLGVFGVANAAGNGFYSYGVIKLLYFKIEQDGVMVYDLIPVRFLNEDGIWEGAMYDLVSEELFLNQGTGSFIIGPDL